MDLAEIEAIAAFEARPSTASILADLRAEVATGFAGSAAEDLAFEILFGLMPTDPHHDDAWALIEEVMR